MTKNSVFTNMKRKPEQASPTTTDREDFYPTSFPDFPDTSSSSGSNTTYSPPSLEDASDTSLFGSSSEDNSSLFSDLPLSLGGNGAASLSKPASYVFTPKGYEFVRNKQSGSEGEAKGFFVKDEAGAEFLVKPFIEENKADVIREYAGLKVLGEMIKVLKSNIIIPEFSLQKDKDSNKFGLFIKMIPGFAPNNEITVLSAQATPMKKRRFDTSVEQTHVTQYYDLPLMMVLSMLLGDNDCSPANSGSFTGEDNRNYGVRLDLGQAFYWMYAKNEDFMVKLHDYFNYFYAQSDPIKKYSSDFERLCTQLPKLNKSENLERMYGAISGAIQTLRSHITDEELAAIGFKNETVSPSFEKQITETTYRNFDELRTSLQEMVRSNITEVLPDFIKQVKAKVIPAKGNAYSLLQTASPIRNSVGFPPPFYSSASYMKPVEGVKIGNPSGYLQTTESFRDQVLKCSAPGMHPTNINFDL